MKLSATISVSRRPRTDNDEQMAAMITAKTMSMNMKDFTQAVKDLNTAGMVIGEKDITVKANQFEIQSTSGDTNLTADSDGNLQVKANLIAAAFNVAAPTTAQGTSFINKFLVDTSLAMCITTWGAVLDNKAVIGTTDKIALGDSTEDRATPVFLIRQGSRFFVLNPLLFSEGVLQFYYRSISTSQRYGSAGDMLTKETLYYSRVKEGDPGYSSNNPLYSDSELKNKANISDMFLESDEMTTEGYTVYTANGYNFVDGTAQCLNVYNAVDGLIGNAHNVYIVGHYSNWTYSTAKGYVSSGVTANNKKTSVSTSNPKIIFSTNLPAYAYNTNRISDSSIRSQVANYLNTLQNTASKASTLSLYPLAEIIYNNCREIVMLQSSLLYYCRMYVSVDDVVEKVITVSRTVVDYSDVEDYGTGSITFRFFPQDYDTEVDIDSYEDSESEAEFSYTIHLLPTIS